MENDFSIKVKRYKCFDKDAQGFDKIMPINVIIGKNNSGKSTLIDLIPYVISPKNSYFPPGNNVEVIITQNLTEENIKIAFSETLSRGYSYGNDFDYGKKFINSNISYRLAGERKEFVDTEIKIDVLKARTDFETIVSRLKNPLEGKTFYYITAERNIIPEVAKPEIKIEPNGEGVTNLITTIINDVERDSRIIQKNLFGQLVKIIYPDIEFSNIIPQKHSTNYWEIFFETADESKIALSKMGSGIKTILQVLTNLIVVPIIQKKPLKDCIFAFEELENNLHPAMQRRLFEYLKKFTLENKATLFITTHSNIVIDIFGNDENAQIVHIKKEGSSTIVKTTDTYESTKNILKDLDIRASDILQSNGVIWVEGPSDRNYINKWISLINPDLQEGLHYSILPYGGKVLSNYCFDYGWLKDELIPLLKINTNAFVVIDKDGKKVSDQLNSTKSRIQEEIGIDKCWITKGREIENYLTKNTLESWLSEKHNTKGNILVNPLEKIEDILSNSVRNLKLKYTTNKTFYSGEVTSFITYHDLDILDLKHKMNSLVATINEWNSK